MGTRQNKMLHYLGSPYSHADDDVRCWRFKAACDAVAVLSSRGFLVYSPIAHTHPVLELNSLAGDFETWRDFDETLIERSDVILVLLIPGWRESKGLLAELRYARTLRKDVGFVVPEFDYRLVGDGAGPLGPDAKCGGCGAEYPAWPGFFNCWWSLVDFETLEGSCYRCRPGGFLPQQA